MKKVLIKAKIISKDDCQIYEGEGKYDPKKKIIKYQDQNALVTLFINDDILLRETAEIILSYKYKENSENDFEIYLKDTKRCGYVKLKTYQIKRNDNKYEVEYNIDGNNYNHIYQIEWRIL